MIDELTIYDRALSDVEIQNIFLLGSRGKCGEEDNDGDGFPSPEDCNDSDPDINPDATEILCNSIDENCNGLADDDIETERDENGRLTYKGRVIRMYPISRIKQLFTAAALAPQEDDDVAADGN